MTCLSIFLLVAAIARSGLQPQMQVNASQEKSDTLKSQVAESPSLPVGQPDAIARATRGVVGSKHDFSLLTGRMTDACGACHVPHVQAVRPKQGEDEPFSLAFYRLGGQREVLVPDRYMPGPTSLICLSCHNGAVASSTVASSHVLLSAHRGGFEIDGFSTRDHPIGLEYPAHKAGYRPRAQVVQSGVIRLPENRMECVSCHDPHNAVGESKMLVMSNRRSALCLSCHEK